MTSFPSSKMNSAKVQMIIQKHINFFREFTFFVVVLIPMTFFVLAEIGCTNDFAFRNERSPNYSCELMVRSFLKLDIRFCDFSKREINHGVH